eukprot:scaffold907_cov247-Pinguiococcus_pyrenoidosus.AAC.15
MTLRRIPRRPVALYMGAYGIAATDARAGGAERCGASDEHAGQCRRSESEFQKTRPRNGKRAAGERRQDNSDARLPPKWWTATSHLRGRPLARFPAETF